MGIPSQLRGLLSSENVIVAPGCHDALGARLIARAGFPAVYMSGNATTASLIGSPDLALLGMAEMVNRARQIALSVKLPLICDADTGYGGVHNVFRTVREYEAAGVAAIHIEDQAFPKRCAAMPGVSLMERKDAEDRVKVALESRKNRDFLIIARTDARPALGIEEAWHRGRALCRDRGGYDLYRGIEIPAGNRGDRPPVPWNSTLFQRPGGMAVDSHPGP